MSLESYCAACTYLGDSANYDGKYYCDRKGEYHYANDSKCYSFCEAYSRTNSSRENMYNNSCGHQGSGCYITTALCQILGYPDNNYYLNILRKFRDTELKTNPKYLPLLITYDMIGPQIANGLRNDKDAYAVAKQLFENYISKSVSAIEVEEPEIAINIYCAMTEALAEKYGLNTNIMISSEMVNNVDMETVGKGRVRKLIPSTNR